GHAAAAGFGGRSVEAGGLEQREVGARAAERLLVAMAVQQRLAADAARFPVARLQDFAEREHLLRELRRAGIVGQELEELVLEDRMAAGLEYDHGHAGFDLRREGGDNLLERRLRLVQHAEIVIRPAAAKP